MSGKAAVTAAKATTRHRDKKPSSKTWVSHSGNLERGPPYMLIGKEHSARFRPFPWCSEKPYSIRVSARSNSAAFRAFPLLSGRLVVKWSSKLTRSDSADRARRDIVESLGLRASRDCVSRLVLRGFLAATLCLMLGIQFGNDARKDHPQVP